MVQFLDLPKPEPTEGWLKGREGKNHGKAFPPSYINIYVICSTIKAVNSINAMIVQFVATSLYHLMCGAVTMMPFF